MHTGKLVGIIQEMIDKDIDLMGISETFWSDTGDFITSIPTDPEKSFGVIYSGENKSRRGVRFIVLKGIANSISYYQLISERVIGLKLKSKERNTLIIQIYASNEEADTNTKEAFYEELQMTLNEMKKYGDRVIILGDFSGKVGEGMDEQGSWSIWLRRRNENGQLLVDFCKANDLLITNTWYQQKKGAQHQMAKAKNQIDYILINKRYRNNMTNAKSRPGMDCGSDHNPVIMKLKLRLKKIIKAKREKNGTESL